MIRRNYGRRSLSNWIDSELGQSNPYGMIFCGVFCTLAFLGVRLACGTPYRMILNLGIASLLPPIWIMTLLRGLSFLCVGCAAGLVLCRRERGVDREKYRGCLFFVLLMLVELLWYPTIFGSGLLFLGMLESILCLCLSVTVTACFSRVSKLASVILFLHTVWLIYLLILSCTIFFGN